MAKIPKSILRKSQGSISKVKYFSCIIITSKMSRMELKFEYARLTKIG